jgi:hypothetical protein
VTHLETLFPGLKGSGFSVTSPPTLAYNCIAWAAGDTTIWWWPDPDEENDAVFWPANVAREETLPAFLEAFATLGYEPCSSQDLEDGFEKIALFALPDGAPTHAARQLLTGNWTSKLGALEDIEHPLHAVSGAEYGVVVQVLRRQAKESGGGEEDHAA